MSLRLINREFTDSQSRTGSYPKGVVLDTATSKYTIEFICTYHLSAVNQIIKEGNRFRLISGSWKNLIGAYKGANIDFIIDNNRSDIMRICFSIYSILIRTLFCFHKTQDTKKTTCRCGTCSLSYDDCNCTHVIFINRFPKYKVAKFLTGNSKYFFSNNKRCITL